MGPVACKLRAEFVIITVTPRRSLATGRSLRALSICLLTRFLANIGQGYAGAICALIIELNEVRRKSATPKPRSPRSLVELVLSDSMR
jgi:hypothetical protein